MANEGSTKPTYSELEAEILRVRGLLQRIRDKVSASGSHDDQRVNDYNHELLDILDESCAEKRSNMVVSGSEIVPEDVLAACEEMIKEL